MAPPPTRATCFEGFVAPARAAPQVWRLGLGVGLAALAWMAASLVLALAGGAVGAGPRLSLILGLLGFGGLSLGVWLAARLLHRRRPAALCGPGGFRASDAAIGAAVVAAAGLVAAVPLAVQAMPERQLGWGAWAAWLPLAIPAIVVQASAEELAFRGYLMQGLAARFRSPLVWRLAPAVLFGLLHWAPEGLGGAAVLSATVAGLVLADVTVRTGNLSAAIGLHVANNLIALLVIAPAGPLGVLSLWLLPRDPGSTALLTLLDVTTTLAAWGLWRGVRRRLHSPDPGSI